MIHKGLSTSEAKAPYQLNGFMFMLCDIWCIDNGMVIFFPVLGICFGQE